MSFFFEKQPSSCRMPLQPNGELHFPKWWSEQGIDTNKDYIAKVQRVMFFDPTALYERIASHLDPFKRHQGIGMDVMFPHTHDGVCSCGCGGATKQYKKGKDKIIAYHKWATHLCSPTAGDICSIINNYFQKPSKYISYYAGRKCCVDGCTTPHLGLELDHIVGVKHGGGGSWLSNYRWLCAPHHRVKTNDSFGHGKKAKLKKKQTKLTFVV